MIEQDADRSDNISGAHPNVDRYLNMAKMAAESTRTLRPRIKGKAKTATPTTTSSTTPAKSPAKADTAQTRTTTKATTKSKGGGVRKSSSPAKAATPKKAGAAGKRGRPAGSGKKKPASATKTLKKKVSTSSLSSKKRESLLNGIESVSRAVRAVTPTAAGRGRVSYFRTHSTRTPC